ncbi:transcription factor IIb [Plasmodium gonderi]|uniref:Transcription factor IIb n=1 Tax=Plasmodium gonderi TaxID=77519 RepID=A0A1Y1JG24_PLAGO|nr:transcription factor IIb [Plasmodium gonderi]GAW81471.1 transcription factor IIb [Plasmodium gonderi]
MYRNKYQPNVLSLLLSAGSKPLDLWKTKTKKGCVRKVLDDSIKLSAIEIMSENTSDSYIYTAPEKFTSLAITHPFIVLIVKNMNKYFSFRISLMDDKNCRRTFRISNFQTVTRLSNKWCTMPMILNEGWNIIQINLKEYTEKAFKTKYVETTGIQINASVRIRCIYFCDKIYNNDELKEEFKIFFKKKEKPKYIPPQHLKNPLKKMTIRNIITEGEAKRETPACSESNNEKVEEHEKESVTSNATDHAADNAADNAADSTADNADMAEAIELYKDSTDDPFFENKNEDEGYYLAHVIANDETQVGEESSEATIETDTILTDEPEHLTHIKNLEMDVNNVLYEDVNYDTYNNDDN